MGRWPRRPVLGGLVALVLVVPALAAGCTIRARPEPPSTVAPAAAPTTTVATVGGTTVASRAFLLDWGSPGYPIRPVPAGPLVASWRDIQELGTHESVNPVLVFPLLRAPPRCVRRAELWLRVLRFDHPQATFAAYPSLLVSLASERPATRFGGASLIDNRPRGTGTLTGDGAWMRFDITGLYRTWARGGPFPSQGLVIDPGTPLVVDVRPVTLAEPDFEARFAGLDQDRDTAPQLRWRVTRGC
jgi:hypothetical protein